MFVGSSFKICSFLDDLPTELRWQVVLDEVSEFEDNESVDDTSDEKSADGASRTALQSLNQLINSAKDDVQRRILGVMTRTTDALSVCIRHKTVLVTSTSCSSTPWNDVRDASDSLTL